ncbi:virulence RhuM family protein [Salinicola salarius]|uniref:virulence RhuM family protein n=1 Tax=Salinicola salarius TaxID=430457 RepID=UPI000DA19C77|nr:virulence RhuM family protein [Salinicola salarius]
MSEGEIILYTTEDGQAEIQLRAVDGTVWLTQGQMAELFASSPQGITQLVRAIYDDEELTEAATCKEFLQVRSEGGRQVRRSLKHYNLELILAVGYRVRSPRGVQFRRWASTILKEYLVKGFVMHDERLKDPTWDYFDELLERIRDIRASEARFYQKVRDILALSEDYDPSSPAVPTFYATIQNKMLNAVTSHTAGELIRARANPEQPNMGLTTWKNADKGRPLRKADVGTAKNYLAEAEIKELNLIVETFLNTAELRATRRQTMRLAEWERVLDTFLTANELPKLEGPGSISAEAAKRIAHERYEAFDARRKAAQKQAADEAGDLEELKRIADVAKSGKRGRGDD